MATESNPNTIADFDIDEVIDWDKHDIPSKDIEFDPLQSLNLASNVAPSSQKSATTSTGRDGLVLRNQLLASQQTAGVLRRETGAAIVGMPQVSQTSAINPVFPGDPSSLIADIRQEYLHAHNAAARSRTPPTPTFPSENFDLPPITPPGSLHAQSGYSVGQQPLRMALVSNLNRQAAVSQRLQTFVQPSLPPLGPIVGGSLEEGSNIEQLIDEIVERDMPQGVSEPIVFAPQVSQQPNPSTARMQRASQQVQKGIPSVPVRAASPGHLPVVQTNASGKTSLSGSPLNSVNTVGSPGSPLASSRSPSPKIKQTVHTAKVSVPLRPGNQPMRLTSTSPGVQPGSPLQSMGMPAPQSPVKTTRSLAAQGNHVASSSQMLQMAVPSAVVSSSSVTQVSPNVSSSNALQIKQNGGMPGMNSQISRVPLSSSTVQPNTSTMVPQRHGVNVASQNMAAMCTANNSSSPSIPQGAGIVPITLQSNSAGKPIQGIPFQSLANNPKLLNQLVKAMGQSNAKQASLGQVSSGTNVQAGQPLICYVVPQNSVSGAQTLQTKNSIPFTASGQPVKMILVNANSPLKSQVLASTPSTTTVMRHPVTSNLSQKSSSLAAQTLTAGREFESSSSAESLPLSFASQSMLSSLVTPGVSMSQDSATPSVVTTLSQLGLTHQNITQPVVTLPVFNTSQQNPVRSAGVVGINNPHGKPNSSGMGSASVAGGSNIIPVLQTPLSSGNTPGGVVQITFVNEATAISQVVAASTSLTSAGQSITISPSPVGVAAENVAQAPGMSPASLQPAVLSVPQESDEDDDDSTPLSRVAESLKKTGVTDDVKKKKKKKKEKGTKRKKRDKDNPEPSKPLTAYEIFFKETQAAIRLQNQSVQFEDIRKIVDQMWKNSNENHKKVYQEKQEKLQQEYNKALEEYRAKKVSQEDAPSPKHVKLDTTETTGLAAVAMPTTIPREVGKDSSIPGAKPLNRVGQSSLVGKPVATVTPMATVKTASNPGAQPAAAAKPQSAAPAKPKKSKVTVNPISQRICLFDGCNMPARTTKERGTQYCSNECIVKHCREAFSSWVAQKNVKTEVS